MERWNLTGEGVNSLADLETVIKSRGADETIALPGLGFQASTQSLDNGEANGVRLTSVLVAPATGTYYLQVSRRFPLKISHFLSPSHSLSIPAKVVSSPEECLKK